MSSEGGSRERAGKKPRSEFEPPPPQLADGRGDFECLRNSIAARRVWENTKRNPIAGKSEIGSLRFDTRISADAFNRFLMTRAGFLADCGSSHAREFQPNTKIEALERSERDSAASSLIASSTRFSFAFSRGSNFLSWPLEAAAARLIIARGSRSR